MNDKKDQKTIELTQEGYEELRAELNELINDKLPKAIKRVVEAREYGDLSENSEYHDARNDKDLIDARIGEIEEILEKAKIVKATKSKNTVGMGSQVTAHFKDQKTKKRTFQIVGEYEANPIEGKISSVSPLGKALMSHKKGDEVAYQAPAGEITYVITDIK
ncbi:transcription elongation factor GreA [Patescibacteria group bacterium]|nr:transcription elongation factor GreA [Patescibacteria group bacterium]MBU1967249.1 transcription elongation factor GreA [Patescibacteria group bacterium]MBU2543589.1 transcription elongation factor GreA [Patescibacteria group bacterium]